MKGAGGEAANSDIGYCRREIRENLAYIFATNSRHNEFPEETIGQRQKHK